MNIERAINQKRFESEHHKMFVNVIFTANIFDTITREVFNQFGITNPQYNILRILNGASPKPLSAGEIKRVMLFKNSDVTRLIDRLKSKDLVERTICPDNRRKMDISITKEGKALLRKIRPQLEIATEEYYQEKLSASEAKKLNELLDKINQ